MSSWEKSVGASDHWFTPAYVFDALGEHFDQDVAAVPDGCIGHVPGFNAINAGSLEARWVGFVWCNPPFGGRNGLEPWITKFFEHGDGVLLTPDRTSAPWFWQAWSRADLVLFTRKIRFERPDGRSGDSPSNGTALWASGPRACAALRRAQRSGLGVLGLPLAGAA